MGTAVVCSGTAVSKRLSTATNSSIICGSGTPRVCTTGEMSPICSTVCRRTRSCGLTPRGGQAAPPGSASNYRSKSSGWGGGASGASPCSSSRTLLLPSPGHVLSSWSCMVVTLGQSHGDAHPCIPQVHARRRRSLRRLSAPVVWSARSAAHMKSQ